MSKTKVLIVEDETIVALDIKSAVKKLDFEVTNTVTNYDDALQSVENNQPNIILMDINLENSKDGIQTATDIQKKHNIPVIYLTAYSDEDTIKRAALTNPVGYMLKPFKRDELKSTILLGIYKSSVSNTVIDKSLSALGEDYYYCFKTSILYYKNEPIKLGKMEALLLRTLIDAKGGVVTFENLEYQLWPDKVVSSSSLRTLIYRLRTKLDHKFIKSTPSFGCQFIRE